MQHLRTRAKSAKTDNRLAPPTQQRRLALDGPNPHTRAVGTELGRPHPTGSQDLLSWKRKLHPAAVNSGYRTFPSLPLKAAKRDSAPQRMPVPGQLAVAGPPAPGPDTTPGWNKGVLGGAQVTTIPEDREGRNPEAPPAPAQLLLYAQAVQSPHQSHCGEGDMGDLEAPSLFEHKASNCILDKMWKTVTID